MALEHSSQTFCVLLIFTIKLTLALGGCRSALSPEDARVTTVRPPQCSHVTEAESRLMFIRSLHQQAAQRLSRADRHRPPVSQESRKEVQ